MIKKFLRLNNLGVFKDFEWDAHIKDKKGKVLTFDKINILYGRNYSGKTTLSRLLRYFQIGKGLEKYTNASFEVELENGQKLDSSLSENNPLIVRVFNEDFVRENLYFVNNPGDSSGVMPFAVLGENADIERDIQNLKELLGINIEGQETKLYLDKIRATQDWINADKNYKSTDKALQDLLAKKATDRHTGIKYQSELYGDQNYTVAKLKAELDIVTSKHLLSEEEIDYYKQSLREQSKEISSIGEFHSVDFVGLNDRIKSLIEQPIVAEGKIAELVSNAMANKWVEEGCTLHKDKSTCLFCGNPITSNRWQQLEKHYDESTKELQDRLSKAEEYLKVEIQRAQGLYTLKKEDYYQNLHNEIQAIQEQVKICKDAYISALNKILEQVQKRKESIHSVFAYEEYSFAPKSFSELYIKIQTLISQGQEYGKNLSRQQAEAKEKLRLGEIARFKEEIGYKNRCKDIALKSQEVLTKKDLKEAIERKITNLEEEIARKERLQLNEEGAVVRVNDILQCYFGHQYIELRAIEGTEGVQFDVYRHGEKAYNLSEGERNLVAFAYFVAKLEDVETRSSKPIIWIDDPISSLDSNHIFFIYSLISEEIAIQSNRWSQLFLSTHNLEFLRFLKRIGKDKEVRWILIERKEDTSSILCMPEYMKMHMTEFNYLFHQIYKCSRSSEEENHELFYSFGNNARKFLEMYLYYKYPDNEKEFTLSKLKNFFGDTSDTTVVHRMTNEMSHLNGLFERGMTVLDIPEMKKCAQFILRTIQQKDPEQYKAFCSSIGELAGTD